MVAKDDFGGELVGRLLRNAGFDEFFEVLIRAAGDDLLGGGRTDAVEAVFQFLGRRVVHVDFFNLHGGLDFFLLLQRGNRRRAETDHQTKRRQHRTKELVCTAHVYSPKKI